MTPAWIAALIVSCAAVLAAVAWDMRRYLARLEQEERHGPRPSRAERRQLAAIERHLTSDAAGLFQIPPPKETDPS